MRVLVLLLARLCAAGAAAIVEPPASSAPEPPLAPPPPSALLLQVTVINCTAVSGSSFFVPLAARLDASDGSLSRRIGTRAAPDDESGSMYNLSSFDSNIAILSEGAGECGGGGTSCVAFVEGTDMPPGYSGGIRTVVAAVDLAADRVLQHVQVVPKNVTHASLWNALPARKLLPLQGTMLMAQHRTETMGGGLPPSLQEWVEVYDVGQTANGTAAAGAPYWTSTVVYNDSQPLAADPIPYFGQAWDYDRLGGLLYSQGTSPGGRVGDIIVWDVQARREVRTLPRNGSALAALFFNPSDDADGHTGTLGGLVRTGGNDNVDIYDLVSVDARTGVQRVQRTGVELPQQYTLEGTESAFDPASQTLSLILVDPTGHTDWSGGDPKGVLVAQVPVDDPEATVAVELIVVEDVLPECAPDRDLRFMYPTLSYLP